MAHHCLEEGAPLRQHDVSAPRPQRRRTARRRTTTALGLSLVALVLSGCAGRVQDGFLPRAVTEGGERVTSLWNGAWIAAREAYNSMILVRAADGNTIPLRYSVDIYQPSWR